jgi:hypothetical protein
MLVYFVPSKPFRSSRPWFLAYAMALYPTSLLPVPAQSNEIKFPPWTILWFRILGISSVENIARLRFFFVSNFRQYIVSSALIDSTLLSS